MAKSTKIAVVQRDHAADLKPFGLEPGDEVRFKTSETAGWRFAKAIGVNKDDSLSLSDSKSGWSRAIYHQFVERKVTGPRGGTKWVPIEKRGSSDSDKTA